MTICDIRAVGPGVWNGWKAELLRTLYWETEHLIEGEDSIVARERRVAAAREELRAALPKWSDHDFAAYAARHQAPYWLKVDLPHKIRHANVLNMSEVESPGPLVDYVTEEARGITELTIIAPTILGCSRRLPAPAPRRRPTSSTRRSSRPPTGWRST